MAVPYLYANPNRHAPVRTNGIRFHGYPQRTKPVRLIVVHTAESTPDYVGEDGGAEAVARFQSGTDRPSSYHRIYDSDSRVVMLPDEAVAFGAKGANSDGIHLSLATKAHLWPGKPDWWRDGAVHLLAADARDLARADGIPARRLTRSQIADGRTKGFAAHADTEAVFGTPGRRSDPGGAFPWDHFLQLVDAQEDDVSPELERIIRQTATDAHMARDAATKAKAALGRIEKQLDGRDVADDLVRIRQSLRPIGAALELVADVNGTAGEDITA